MLELEQLLTKQCNVEGYFVWIDSIFETELKKVCVIGRWALYIALIKVSTDSDKLDVCKNIVRLWNHFVSHLNAELSACQARSKGNVTQ